MKLIAAYTVALAIVLMLPKVVLGMFIFALLFGCAIALAVAVDPPSEQPAAASPAVPLSESLARERGLS